MEWMVHLILLWPKKSTQTLNDQKGSDWCFRQFVFLVKVIFSKVDFLEVHHFSSCHLYCLGSLGSITIHRINPIYSRTSRETNGSIALASAIGNSDLEANVNTALSRAYMFKMGTKGLFYNLLWICELQVNFNKSASNWQHNF
jgi:hypothetical protein